MDALLLEAPGFDSRATLHGDLHSNNIVIGTDRAFLIDLDRMASGPPSVEIGSLLAELAYRECLATRSPDFAQLDAIAQEYARHASWPVDLREVRWHLAAALVRERSYRCVTSLKPGRVEAVPRLLQAATDALRRAA
jgi:aminoglycoside phosphotransferase (APT) family kinase protein